MGKINITPEDFQVAAIKYRKELLMLPIIALQTSTKYMTVMSGIAGKETIGRRTSTRNSRPTRQTVKARPTLN